MAKCKQCGLNPNSNQSDEQQKWENDYIKEHGICSACDNENETTIKEVEVKIRQEKIADNKANSFWYDGEIASIDNYSLIATGEIRLIFDGDDETFRNRQAVEEAERLGYTDQALANGSIEFINNNWFEVVDNSSDECILGDVCFTYDEAIEMLKIYYEEKIYQ